MQDNLIGYLLDAIDSDEALNVQQALDTEAAAGSHRLTDRLTRLRSALQPLEADRTPEPPPPGLADRTLKFVRSQAAVTAAVQQAVTPPPVEPLTASPAGPSLSPEPTSVVAPPSKSLLDRLIMGATAIAAMVLLAPLLLETIEESRTRRVERKLGVLAGALHGYADSHREYPTPPASGPLSRAGLYAPTLVAEHRLQADDGTLLVPGSSLSQSGTFRIPSVEELERAVGTARLEMLVRQMGGDFGYTLGHRNEAGDLQSIGDSRRSHHPIMADAPADHGFHARHHPSGLHHVLFEDGRVQRVFDPTFADDHDHLYRNHDGDLAAGVDPDDSAIGGSHHQP